jgi:hypothetical protein
MSNLIEKKYIQEVSKLEEALMNSDDSRVLKGKKSELIAPLNHTFCHGIYVREMFVKEGSCLIGKIHKHDHVWFLMKGSLLIATQDGTKKVEAPFYNMSKAGTKRVGYALEDCLFINICPNPDNKTNIEELEKDIVVDNYKEYKQFLINNK